MQWTLRQTIVQGPNGPNCEVSLNWGIQSSGWGPLYSQRLLGDCPCSPVVKVSARGVGAGVRSLTASDQARKNWEVCALSAWCLALMS